MRKLYFLLSFIVVAACMFFLFGPGKRSIFFESKEGRGIRFEENEEEDGAREALKQEILMTRDPRLGYVPTERLLQYQEVMREHPFLRRGNPSSGAGGRHIIVEGGGSGSSFQTLSGSGLTWTERGPNNIGGRCRAILVDRSDASGNTVLVGSVSGGLWRTTNFTAATPTWTQHSTVLANLALTTLAQAPTHPRILYSR